MAGRRRVHPVEEEARSDQQTPAPGARPASAAVIPATGLPADLRRLPPAAVLGLQRVAGNRATAGLLGGAASTSVVVPPARGKRKVETTATTPPPAPIKRPRRGPPLPSDQQLDNPTLTFESQYKGARTQKLSDAQEMSFPQQATLSKPAGGPSAKNLYDFRQQVEDSWDVLIPDEAGQPVSNPDNRSWQQDGPYRPPYDSNARGKEMIDLTADSIAFRDTPGWSTTSKVAVNQWLASYQISFRWVVTRIGTGKTDTSPTVTHTVSSDYNNGNDGPVTATPAGNHTWTLNLR